jgi:hypothetical protein
VFAGGIFNTIGGLPRKRLASFDISTGNLDTWDPFAGSATVNGGVYCMAELDSFIFAGGDLTYTNPITGYTDRNLAVVNKFTGEVNELGDVFKFSARVNALLRHESSLFVGGDFSNIYSGDLVNKRYFSVIKFVEGPIISHVPDVSICYNDTVGPLPVTISDSINVSSVVLQGSSSDTLLVPESGIIFSGSGANRYVTVVFNTGMTGTCRIDMVATNQNGGVSFIYFYVTRNAPVVQINGIPDICLGDSTILTAAPGFVLYNWSTGESTASIEVFQSGIYTVTVEDVLGCTAVDSFIVSNYPVPAVVLTSASSPGICLGDSVLLNATPGFPSYQWQRSGLPIPGATADSYYASSSANYRCSVTDSNGCSNVTNSVRVRIICLPPGPNHSKAQIVAPEALFEVAVHPNPSDEHFNISSNCP